MEYDDASATSQTLLGRLRRSPADEGAWSDFVRRYGHKIAQWCRQWGLQEADAQDVTQTVLALLVRQMREFTYDPSGSFRAWLKTVTQHAWGKYVAGLQRGGQGSGGNSHLDTLQSLEARADLEARLAEEFDKEVLQLAMQRVTRRVEAQTWEAFRLTALDGVPTAEAAARTGMQVGMVYVARGRVLKLLREEIQRLERDS